MLTYSRLREIQMKEAESLEPVKLDKDFYTQLKTFLDAKKLSALKAQSFMEMREYENAKKIAKLLLAKRKEKLLMLSILSDDEPEGLTDEEHIFLKQIRSLSDSSFGQIYSIFEDNKEEKKMEKLKIVKPIEPYKGFDNNIYGPYKEGQEILVPSEEAEWLLKSKMAEHSQ
ncbi:hypothetical protein KJ780_04520 [Candidatus Micrarchaeota archaeon]|nr:hypothetical protein [Candidatus Micrarchaeota archaeon]